MKGFLAFIAKALLGLVAFSILWVGAYRLLNPPTTYLMIRDRLNGVEVKQTWVGLNEMSRHIPRAVIAAEDARFCEHNGFDVEAIEKAIERNKKGKTVRGGSTACPRRARPWPGVSRHVWPSLWRLTST